MFKCAGIFDEQLPGHDDGLTTTNFTVIGWRLLHEIFHFSFPLIHRRF